MNTILRGSIETANSTNTYMLLQILGWSIEPKNHQIHSCRYLEGSIETTDSSKYIVAGTWRGVLKQLFHQNTLLQVFGGLILSQYIHVTADTWRGVLKQLIHQTT